MPASDESRELFGITMTNDEVMIAVGAEAAGVIDGAGFVLVPKQWRDRAMDAMRAAAQVGPDDFEKGYDQAIAEAISHLTSLRLVASADEIRRMVKR